MDLYKKKAGGCSSMSYAGVSDNYMLMDNALVKTGGGRKNSQRKGCDPLMKDIFNVNSMRRRGGNPSTNDMFGGEPNNAKDNNMFGGEPLKRRGGNPSTNDMFGGEPNNAKDNNMFGGEPLKRRGGNPFFADMTGGEPLKRRGGNPLKNDDLRRRGGYDAVPNPNMLGFGSAMKGFTDTIASMGKGGDPRKNDGGCGFASCNKKVAKRKGGTTGLEVAPFISSLVLLGLRAANDKALQVGITKKLGSLVSEKTKTKTKSKSKTKTKSIFD